MRATELIRDVLDLIDRYEQQNTQDELPNEPGEQTSRFKQIVAMLGASKPALANSPNEIVAPVSAVTTLAGGGVNGSKHPADIRVKDPRGFE